NPAPGATGVPVAGTVAVTFSEPVQAGTIAFVLKNAAGATVPATVSYDAASWTATLTPNAPLNPTSVYTVAVSGVRDASGNLIAGPVSWSFTTASPVSGVGIWDNTTTPASASWNDSSSLEVGVKFRSNAAGYITGLRFYKGSGNTGTHV